MDTSPMTKSKCDLLRKVDSELKCYDKHIDYIVPFFECNFCKRPIRQGEMLCSVILEWGSSKSACLECYEKFEVDNGQIPD